MNQLKIVLRKAIPYIDLSAKIIIGIVMVITFLILLTSKTSLLVDIRSMVVLTGSMQPTIPQGSIVFTQKDNWYYPGDIITFKNKGNLMVTHRLIQKVQTPDGEMYKVKGDANNSSDSELAPPKSVIGKSIFSIPHIGNFVTFLRSLPGFISFIILPSLLFIASEIWSIKKELEKEIEKKYLAKFGTA